MNHGVEMSLKMTSYCRKIEFMHRWTYVIHVCKLINSTSRSTLHWVKKSKRTSPHFTYALSNETSSITSSSTSRRLSRNSSQWISWWTLSASYTHRIYIPWVKPFLLETFCFPPSEVRNKTLWGAFWKAGYFPVGVLFLFRPQHFARRTEIVPFISL